MRRFFRGLKAVAVLAGAALCALFAYALLSSPVFERGEAYEFYLGDSSSAQILVSSDPVLDKLLHSEIRGESVRYTGDRYEALKEKFRAEVVFEEEMCGIHNYYLYSPVLGGGVLLKEGKVNLHIAVGENRTTAGTPLIFGGF